MSRLCVAAPFAVGVALLGAQSAVAVRTNMPYADARPILSKLPADLMPAALRGLTSLDLEAAWPKWVSSRDREIRARLARGDDDSVINFLLFGVTFTKQPRITERNMDDRLANSTSIVQGRIADMAAGIASPGSNGRLQFARAVVQRKGIDPGQATGRDKVRSYLNGEVKRFLAEREAVADRAAGLAAQAQNDPDVASEAASLFQNRGLSSDTTIFIDFAIEESLKAIKSSRLLAVAPGSLRRIAIVGPGFDFTDKREGYDFYPPQTIQPFAVLDSLIRLGLAKRDDLKVTTFDLSPRINQHLQGARERARAGGAYVLQLPRETAYPWNPLLMAYWRHLGDNVGEETPAVASPPGVKMRAVRIRPSVVLSVTPQDLNLVLQRLAPLADNEQFDLIIATNILIYYDDFEQALALANVWKMLRPGGLFLVNSASKLISSTGYTDVRYSQQSSSKDRVFWYQKSNGRD
jgi:SAM-dependent methyltransferase